VRPHFLKCPETPQIVLPAEYQAFSNESVGDLSYSNIATYLNFFLVHVKFLNFHLEFKIKLVLPVEFDEDYTEFISYLRIN
jgi:hypothetical protein